VVVQNSWGVYIPNFWKSWTNWWIGFLYIKIYISFLFITDSGGIDFDHIQRTFRVWYVTWFHQRVFVCIFLDNLSPFQVRFWMHTSIQLGWCILTQCVWQKVAGLYCWNSWLKSNFSFSLYTYQYFLKYLKIQSLKLMKLMKSRKISTLITSSSSIAVRTNINFFHL